MRIFIALVLALAVSAHADERAEKFMKRFVPQWQASCQIPGHAFRLSFKSEGGDPTEDDMVASIQWDGDPATSLSLKPALFVAGRLNANVSTQCDNITSVLLQSGNLLVLLRRDDRPSVDRLLAVLIEGKTGKPLDVIPDIGIEGKGANLMKNRLGLRIRASRKWRQISPEQEPIPLEEWVNVKEGSGKLNIRWETSPR
jgi:hypothetical protein